MSNSLTMKKNAMQNRLTGIIAVLIVIWQASGVAAEPARFPSLVSSLQIKGPLYFCNEPVPLEIRDVYERLEKEMLLTLWDRPQVILWLKRTHRYMPIIEQMLTAADLPDDLKYVALAESALRPHVGSPKGALGFWQFMAGSGRKWGLTIDHRIDQRRNIFFSTEAAIRYFKHLYAQTGTWTLAAAAYNMGEGGLVAETMEQGLSDYYRLYLPLETQRFVFRILAIKMIVEDPEKYGFILAGEDYYPPLQFDEIRFDCFQEIPIRIAARAADTCFKEIKDLNPEIRGYYLAPGSHTLLIPKGKGTDFQKKYSDLVEEYLSTRSQSIYIVKKGDNLSDIAEKYQIPLAALLIWNRLDLNHPIHPGDRLVIHPHGKGKN